SRAQTESAMFRNLDREPHPMSPASSLKRLAENRAMILIGCYRKSDVGDPDVYTRAVVATLMKWPPEVILEVNEPSRGIPSKLKWLPSIAEIVEACESAYAPIERERLRNRHTPLALKGPKRVVPSEAELDEQFAKLGLSHLRPGSRFHVKPRRFSDAETVEA